jgi:hypothetical protein
MEPDTTKDRLAEKNLKHKNIIMTVEELAAEDVRRSIL